MTGKLIIYGATGYTGQLVSEQAKQAGLDFIVAAQGGNGDILLFRMSLTALHRS